MVKGLPLLLLWCLGLLGVGTGGRWALDQLNSDWPEVEPLPAAAMGAAPPAVLLGAAGGLRQVAANWFWIQGYLAWERRDPRGALEGATRAVMAEPEEWFFWRNAARMIAFDFPHWKTTVGMAPSADPEARRRFFAELAMLWLERAERALPEDPAVDLERALICLHILRDRAAAAEWYRRAWEKPEGPYFAARLHGELLRQIGDLDGAFDWYASLYPQLPDNEPAAAKALVGERLKQLAEVLGKDPEALPPALR